MVHHRDPEKLRVAAPFKHPPVSEPQWCSHQGSFRLPRLLPGSESSWCPTGLYSGSPQDRSHNGAPGRAPFGLPSGSEPQWCPRPGLLQAPPTHLPGSEPQKSSGRAPSRDRLESRATLVGSLPGTCWITAGPRSITARLLFEHCASLATVAEKLQLVTCRTSSDAS